MADATEHTRETLACCATKHNLLTLYYIIHVSLFAGAQPGTCPKRIGRVTSTTGLLLHFIQTEASPRSQSFIGVPRIFQS